jgi:ABC-type transporter Mla subunit MlaD
MSIHIDPVALGKFATEAGARSHDLQTLRLSIDVSPDALGNFDEATELVQAINAHTVEVNQRLQATSDALKGLAHAASQAATLSDMADSDIAKKMKSINRTVDEARRKLTPTRV